MLYVDQANISNLKRLWKKYGSHKVRLGDSLTINTNTHWPYRCWFDNPAALTDYSLLQNVPESSIYPIWASLNCDAEFKAAQGTAALNELLLIEQQLIDQHWFCLFEQTAMYLTLSEEITALLASQFKSRDGFTMTTVLTTHDITLWIDIVADSFGYGIDREVIEKLIKDQDMQILMAYYNHQAIATALLFKTGDVIGVHQVGVKKSFQGKGFARLLMQEIIARSLLWQGKHIVLQASAAGKPLYDSLGFKTQFIIKNYRKRTTK